jgi:hypothetical protein
MKNTKSVIGKKSKDVGRSMGSQRKLEMELTKMMGGISLRGRGMEEYGQQHKGTNSERGEEPYFMDRRESRGGKRQQLEDCEMG